MRSTSLLDPDHPLYDTELLRQLRGRRLASRLQVLCVIGAHRFQEMRLLNRVFPNLRHIYLFEPLPELQAALQSVAAQDPRIRVFPVAIADRDGTAVFHVTDNDGESSSLLKFGSHSELFPEVHVQRTVEVTTRRLDSVIAEQGLESPDLLLVDVQGAEYMVLAAMGPQVLQKVRLIYTEVSTERVYESARLLPEVQALLSPRFVNLGYAPLRADVPMHGNAVFVAAQDARDGLALTTAGWVHQVLRRWQRRRRARRAAAGMKAA
jgi:FkbM family methyltransferase